MGWSGSYQASSQRYRSSEYPAWQSHDFPGPFHRFCRTVDRYEQEICRVVRRFHFDRLSDCWHQHPSYQRKAAEE